MDTKRAWNICRDLDNIKKIYVHRLLNLFPYFLEVLEKLVFVFVLFDLHACFLFSKDRESKLFEGEDVVNRVKHDLEDNDNCARRYLEKGVNLYDFRIDIYT